MNKKNKSDEKPAHAMDTWRSKKWALEFIDATNKSANISHNCIQPQKHIHIYA